MLRFQEIAQVHLAKLQLKALSVDLSIKKTKQKNNQLPLRCYVAMRGLLQDELIYSRRRQKQKNRMQSLSLAAAEEVSVDAVLSEKEAFLQ